MSNLCRSLLLFEESFRSAYTKEAYTYYLNRFLKWAKKDYDSLLLLTTEELDVLLQDYLLYLKKRLNPNSLDMHLCVIDKFLMLNDKFYHKKKLRVLLPEKIKPTGERSWTTEEIQTMLEYADNKRAKAVIHLLAASGCRIGALPDIKRKHISDMPDGCLAIVLYAGSKWEYTIFIHSEAAQSLNQCLDERRTMGELLTPESFLFRKSRFIVNEKRPHGITLRGISQILEHLIIKAQIKRVKQGIRYDVQIANGFRKRFNTILKSNPQISYAIAERLMDHRAYLENSYLYTPKDRLFVEYKKAIQDLIINDSERLKIKNRKLEDKKSELELAYADSIPNMGDRIITLEKEVQKLKTNS